MSESQPSARQILESNLDLIRDLIRHVARRHRLRTEEAEEFSSYVWLKMVEGEQRIFRGFRGRCSLRTFLTTVVHRLFLDFRNQAWGKWRSCAEARRLGENAVELDRLISRDGHSLESALEILQRRRGIASHAELLAFAGRIRARQRPRQEGEEALHVLPSATRADERILEREGMAELRKATGSLARALRKLSGQDRMILRMRYQDGLTVRKIASVLGIDDRRLYRRLEQCLARLRATLEGEGVVSC
jgi:RNA polymerase sigma factor (sigma-70 family)